MFKNKTGKLLLFTLAAIVLPLLLACPAYALEPFLNIGLLKFDRVSSAKIESSVISVYTEANGVPVYSFESSSGFTLAPSGDGVSLSRGGELLCVSDGTMLIQGADGMTKIGGISYRGFLKPINRGSSVTVINYIDAEQYLYGVVPGEMPSGWHIEALKAQAVAARSYAYTQTGVHADRGYDLCDSVCCQHYPGASMETESTTSAVDQTAGMLAYYNGEPINAVFSSSSGGHTENSENVWTDTLGYLRGVKEIHENEFLVWNRTFTLEALGNGLAAKGKSVGTVTSVTAEYLPSGRVGKLTFSGTGGTQSVRGDAIRSITSEIGGSLPSTLFEINGYAWSQGGVWDGGSADTGAPVYIQSASEIIQRVDSGLYAEGAEGARPVSGAISVLGGAGARTYGGQMSAAQSVPEGAQNTFTITSGSITLNGRGYGHAVGMSQFGAKGMAEAGCDYLQILKHYYTGIEVY